MTGDIAENALAGGVTACGGLSLEACDCRSNLGASRRLTA